jgi:hypothetical protein
LDPQNVLITNDAYIRVASMPFEGFHLQCSDTLDRGDRGRFGMWSCIRACVSRRDPDVVNSLKRTKLRPFSRQGSNESAPGASNTSSRKLPLDLSAPRNRYCHMLRACLWVIGHRMSCSQAHRFIWPTGLRRGFRSLVDANDYHEIAKVRFVRCLASSSYPEVD